MVSQRKTPIKHAVIVDHPIQQRIEWNIKAITDLVTGQRIGDLTAIKFEKRVVKEITGRTGFQLLASDIVPPLQSACYYRL